MKRKTIVLYLCIPLFLFLLYKRATPLYFIDVHWWLDIVIQRVTSWEISCIDSVCGFFDLVKGFILILLFIPAILLPVIDFVIVYYVIMVLFERKVNRAQEWNRLKSKLERTGIRINTLYLMFAVLAVIHLAAPREVNIYLYETMLEQPHMIVSVSNTKMNQNRRNHLFNKSNNYFSNGDGIIIVHRSDFDKLRFFNIFLLDSYRCKPDIISPTSLLHNWMHKLIEDEDINGFENGEPFVRSCKLCGSLVRASLYDGRGSVWAQGGYRLALFRTGYVGLASHIMFPAIEELGIYNNECYEDVKKKILGKTIFVIPTRDAKIRDEWLVVGSDECKEPSFIGPCLKEAKRTEILRLYKYVFNAYKCQ